MEIAADRFQNASEGVMQLARDPTVRPIFRVHDDDVPIEQFGTVGAKYASLVEAQEVLDGQSVFARRGTVLHGHVMIHRVAAGSNITAPA
ncbi:hypothetical protein [Sphingomonas aquatilis]|uniref:hypothetical protein n=1 Tax=Sphingomonas aquatilis TaxID=93063 RepID=UPI0023F8D50D|nr:hypothetical protein [Sphingomonas aquatilis]